MDGLVGLISFASVSFYNKNEARKIINHLLKVKRRLDDKEKSEQKRNRNLEWDGLNLMTINIDESIFEEFSKHIKNINLSNNLLSECTGKWNNWENVSVINLDGNKLTYIQKEIFELPNLTTLSLNGNELEHLPKDISLQFRFRTLYLRDNKLTNLPKALSHSFIDTLYLDNNKFETLPKCVCEIPTLTYLSLTGNKLILEFPFEFGKMDPFKLTIELKDMDQVSTQL